MMYVESLKSKLSTTVLIHTPFQVFTCPEPLTVFVKVMRQFIEADFAYCICGHSSMSKGDLKLQWIAFPYPSEKSLRIPQPETWFTNEHESKTIVR